MGKSMKALLLAACIFSGSVATLSAPLTSAHALTIIASVKAVSVFKDTIAVGESAQIELEWSTGAKQQIFYSSSDESIATVDEKGIVTGVSDGTVTITLKHSNLGKDKTIDISVSSDVEKSTVYNTSELTLGTKLSKYDTLHYDNKNTGSCANIVNTNDDYDIAFINEKDYVLPFDAELVGIDGLVIYLAPDIEGISYIDGRTLNVGEVIDRNANLLCYDYCIKSADSSNRMIYPVFLTKYYDKYIGDGEIMVSSIDHDSKMIELKSVPTETDISMLLYVNITNKPYDTVIHGTDELDLTGLKLTIGETDSKGNTAPLLEDVTIDEAKEKYDVSYEIKSDAPGSGTCVITITDKNGDTHATADFAVQYGAPVVNGDVNADGELNVADAILLQKWLFAVPDTKITDWNRADLCRDGWLDVFDLCLMKRELIKKENTSINAAPANMPGYCR